MTAVAATKTRARPTASWLHSAAVDAAVALAWVPFAIVALAVTDSSNALTWFVAAVLFLSFSHQPMTLGLVYADRGQFTSRRKLYTWSPLILVGLILAGIQISLVVVAVVGGLWNTHHTLMQRYGLTRIYRRKGGQSGSGRLDFQLLFVWLLVVLAWAAANPATPGHIEAMNLDPTAQRSLEILVDIRPFANVLLVVLLIAAATVSFQWLQSEIGSGWSANPATYFYIGATFGLYLLATVRPIAALLGWVGAHAIEYYVVVQVHLKTRYRDAAQAEPANMVARVVRTRLGAAGTIAAFTLLMLAAVHLAMPQVGLLPYAVAVFAVGGLHIFYDGFIWKLRTPDVAKSLSATGPAA